VLQQVLLPQVNDGGSKMAETQSIASRRKRTELLGRMLGRIRRAVDAVTRVIASTRVKASPAWHIGACGQPASTELLKLADDIFERPRGVDLDRGRCPKQRLHLCDVAKNHLSIDGRLPVRVITACCDPLEKQIDRCTEQGNEVELRIETSLIRLAPSNEEAPADMTPKKVVHCVLSPYPVR
jgi:hypothetical protein